MHVKNFILTLVFIAVLCSANGQVRFQKTYGGIGDDVAEAVMQTSDGGYLLCGHTTGFGSGMKDAYIIRTDSVGTEQWSRTIGGSLDDAATWAVEDNGGFVIGGTTGNYGAGGRDAFLARLNSAGNVVWFRTYGTISADNASFRFNKTADGGFIMAYSYNYSDYQYTLIKTDAAGNKQWSRAYGGAITDVAGHAVQCPDSGYIATGYTYNYGLGLHDFLIMRTNKLGNISWNKTMGGSREEGGSYFLTMTDSSHAFITGQVNNFSFGLCDLIFIKINSETGNVEMAKEYGKAGKSLRPLTGAATLDGGFASDIYDFTPSVSHDMGILRTDSAGKILWVKRYGDTGDDVSFTICNTTDNGFALAGFTTSFGAGGKDIYLVKTDANGRSGIGTPCYERDDTLQEGPYIFGETTPVLPETPPFDFTNSPVVAAAAPVDSSTALICIIPPVAHFQTGDTILCANDCISFTDQSINADSLEWSFEGGTPSFSTDRNPYVCYLSGGVFDVKLVVSNSSGSDSLMMADYITIHPAPPTPFITQLHDTLQCSTNPSYIAYQWYADSTLIPGATGNYYIADHSGNYNVQVADSNGCKISVGINIIITGVRNLSAGGLPVSLSPNPAGDQITISGYPLCRNSIVHICNILGEKIYVFQEDAKSGKTEVTADVSKLTPGIYILHIINESGQWTRRFLKE